jgi:hypothetical protein
MSDLHPRRDDDDDDDAVRKPLDNRCAGSDNDDDDDRSNASSSASSSVIFVRFNASPAKSPPPPSAAQAGPPASIVVPAVATAAAANMKKMASSLSSSSSSSSSSNATTAIRSNDSGNKILRGILSEQHNPAPKKVEGVKGNASPSKSKVASPSKDPPGGDGTAPHEHNKTRTVSADESHRSSGGQCKIQAATGLATIEPRELAGEGTAEKVAVGANAGAGAVAVEEHHRENEKADVVEEESHPEPVVLFSCWMCHMDMTHPYHAVHEHPALSVPTCHCCHEELEEILRKHRMASNSGHGHGDDDDTTASDSVDCLGCGPARDQAVVFLCDACPHQFCAECVVRAAVGDQLDEVDDDDDDKRQKAIVNAVQALDPWHCLACKPPPFLRDLQDRLRAYADDEDDGGEDSGATAEKHELTEADLQRKHDQWTQELVECEDEMAAVLHELETRDNKAGGAAVDDQDDGVDEDRRGLEGHYNCLRHKISRLQENLEDVCNVDLALWYRRVMGIEMPAVDDDAAPPEEVLTADRAIRQRKALEDKERLANLRHAAPMSLAALLDDEYHGVEDLDDDDNEQDAAKGGNSPLQRNVAVSDPMLGWRSSYELPNPELIQHFRREEDALLEARHIPVHRVTERFDRQATRIEDRDEKNRRRKPVGAVAFPPHDADAESPARTFGASTAPIHGKTSPPLIAAEPDQKARPVAGSVEEDYVPTARPQMNGPSTAEPSGLPDASTTPGTRAPVGTIAPHNDGLQPTDGDEAAAIQEERVSTKGNGARLKGDSAEFARSGALVLNPGAERVVTVSSEIATKLKDHQKEGIKFIWNNSFSDLNQYAPDVEEVGKIHGCLLAHNMGLGKFLSRPWSCCDFCTLLTLNSRPLQVKASRQLRCFIQR